MANKFMKQYSTSFDIKEMKNQNYSQAQVAHVCNPSYSGGRDQENRSLKPAGSNSL
jgi:hypothetical protein